MQTVDSLDKAHDDLLILDGEINKLNGKLIAEIEVLNTDNLELRAEIEQRDQQISELYEDLNDMSAENIRLTGELENLRKEKQE